jgi:hypothetical protein
MWEWLGIGSLLYTILRPGTPPSAGQPHVAGGPQYPALDPTFPPGWAAAFWACYAQGTPVQMRQFAAEIAQFPIASNLMLGYAWRKEQSHTAVPPTTAPAPIAPATSTRVATPVAANAKPAAAPKPAPAAVPEVDPYVATVAANLANGKSVHGEVVIPDAAPPKTETAKPAAG